jgi:hypothetical protein
MCRRRGDDAKGRAQVGVGSWTSVITSDARIGSRWRYAYAVHPRHLEVTEYRQDVGVSDYRCYIGLALRIRHDASVALVPRDCYF